jgi:hypothetical protein
MYLKNYRTYGTKYHHFYQIFYNFWLKNIGTKNTNQAETISWNRRCSCYVKKLITFFTCHKLLIAVFHRDELIRLKRNAQMKIGTHQAT